MTQELPERDEPAGYLQLLLENGPFRRLFTARVISLFGDWFNLLAILALLREVGQVDARSFGWILILKMLPGLVVAPLAGVLVDRFSRKGLMIAMDLLRAGIVLCLINLQGLAELWPWFPTVGALYTLVVLQAMAMAIAEPARMAVLPDLVARHDLVTANAMSAASWSLMFTMGTALGGVVTAWLGWKSALGIDLATYLLSAFLLVGLLVPPHPREEDSVHGESFLAGLRYLLARPRLWTLCLVKAGFSLAGSATLVLTILGERVFPIGGQAILGVTALYMARGIGTGLGPILARAICGADPVRSERIIGWAFLWAAVMYLLLGSVGHVVLAVAIVLLAHLGGATIWVFSTVRLQASLPTEVRGRVFATEQAVWKLFYACSTLLFGTAIDRDWLPLPVITSGLGAALLIPAALWFVRGRVLGDPSRLEP